MCSISAYVNKQARHRAGRSLRSMPALRALVAASLLREQRYGIRTVTPAVHACHVSRPSVAAALAILQAEDVELANRVLRGRAP